MPRKNLHKFFISIVFPSILAIALFIVSLFTIVLPSVERNIMDKKKEMIRELTSTAWSLLEEYNQEFKNGHMSLEDAQNRAAGRVQRMRYGEEYKDYFWIIDMQPIMVMHPYRPELINSDLNDYKDPKGKKLFVESVHAVQADGEGFIDYMWQWKDDSTRIVPKLSYVKAYEPWEWIVGTGIYLEDVRLEIRALKYRLLRVSLLITIIIIAIIVYVIRQSLIIENKREQAESDLILSRQKYKSLVEASTEGTLMFLNNTIIFSNLKFSKLIGYEVHEILTLKFEEIFSIEWQKVLDSFEDPDKSVSHETQLLCKDDSKKEVVISVSKIKYDKDSGYIVVAKEVTQQKQLEYETEHLSQELQSSLMLMNQPIYCFVEPVLRCSMDTSIQEAAVLMTRKRRKILFIQNDKEIIGVLSSNDFKRRVIAENRDTQRPVIEIMTSPVVSISENALLYEAILELKTKDISHLATKNTQGEITGVVGFEDITRMQQNSVSYLIKEIEIAEATDEIKKIHHRVPVLVNALIESGDKTHNITRIITSVSDAIVKRILDLAIEEIGTPPCRFAFMVMGSEGRMEQTLLTDQDNAIVFEDLSGEKLDIAYRYFQELGETVNKNLDIVGYKLCKGDVMARNPKWTQPYSVWKEYFSGWVNNSDPQSIMEASIFFDFRAVYGSKELVADLRTHINHTTEHKSVFFYHMAQSVIKYKPPVNVFGNIVGESQSDTDSSLDIKKVILPILGFVRLYALQHNINETNSLLRLKELYQQQVIQKAMYVELKQSYNFLMQQRFRSQSKKILNNLPPDNQLNLDGLTHIEQASLKKILGEISNLQTKVSFDFKGGAV